MPATGRGVRILALGDSYTIGESVNAAERWPVRLAGRLQERGVAPVDVVIVAQTGWTTDELNAGIDAANPSGVFDLVTLLIGVNNQYRGRPAEQYQLEFRGLLHRAIAFAGSRASRVIVLSVPDWGVTPFARQSGRDVEQIALEINAFNTVGLTEAGRAGARFVDITELSRRAESDTSLTASDGLHPSRAMYEEWTTHILPVALEALGTESGR